MPGGPNHCPNVIYKMVIKIPRASDAWEAHSDFAAPRGTLASASLNDRSLVVCVVVSQVNQGCAALLVQRELVWHGRHAAQYKVARAEGYDAALLLALKREA